MKLTKVGGGCDSPHCPTLYETDRGTYVVQGAIVPEEHLVELRVPAGESLVEVPRALLAEFAANLLAPGVT